MRIQTRLLLKNPRDVFILLSNVNNGWMDGWMDGWMMDEWSVYKWMNRCVTNGWIGARLLDEYIDRWMNC